MPDPQPPAPTPAPTPFWRRVAEFAGLSEEIDAVSAAAKIAGTAASTAGDWIQSKLPAPSPAAQAFARDFERPPAGGGGQSPWEAASRFFGSEPVQQTGRNLAEDYQHLWTPKPDVARLAERTSQGITKRSDLQRAKLPEGPGLGWLDTVAAAQNDWIPNLAVDTALDATTPVGLALNADVPFGPAAKAAAPLLAKLGGAAAHLGGQLPMAGMAEALPKGFYSRVDRVADLVGKKGVTPQRLANLLQKGAHPDEVAYRQIPELIARMGNQVISKAELTDHLARHPPPGLGQKILGQGPTPLPFEEWVAERNRILGEVRKTPPPYEHPHSVQMRYQGYVDNLRASASPTKYGPSSHPTLSVPGGTKYREALSTLSRTSPEIEDLQKEVADLQRQMDERQIFTYSGDMPAEDRELADRMAEASNALSEAEGRLPREYEGSHHGLANQFAHIRYDERTLPEHGPGRFLQEVQSDWEHAGREVGYRPPDIDARYRAGLNAVDNALDRVARYENDFHDRYHTEQPFVATPYDQWLDEEIRPEFRFPAHERTNTRAYQEDMERRRRAHEGKALRDALHEDPTRQQLQQAVADADTQLNVLRQEARGVPDLPFKNVWDEIALKQQLADIAQNHPDLQWLGLTSGQTQADRYDLSKQLAKLDYDPRSERLRGWDRQSPNSAIVDESVPIAELHKYIGAGPAERLRGQAAQYDQALQQERMKWSVGPDPEGPGFLIYTPTGEPLQTRQGHHDAYFTEKRALARLDELFAGDEAPSLGPLPSLEGEDLSFGGQWTRQLYDHMLRRRVDKVLAPHGGGKMQPHALPTGAADVPVPGGFYIINDDSGDVIGDGFTSYEQALGALDLEEGEALPWGIRVDQHPPTQAVQTEPSWITQLSPEVKQSIRDKGFDLMSFVPPVLGAGAGLAGAAATDEDEGVGAGIGMAAALPFGPIKLPRAAGSLAGALKRGEGAMHPLRAAAAERVARLTDFADSFPRQSNWRGINDPAYVGAFAGDVPEARRHLRAFAASSPATAVPDNAREAAALQAWRLVHPGQDITHAQTRTLRGQAMGNAGSKWQNVNDAWNDRVMGRSKFNDALKVESFGNFMQDQFGPVGHPMQRRHRPADIAWTPDRKVPLIALPHDMHMLYGAGGQPQELLDDEWAPLRERLSGWEGLTHPETGLPLAGNQGGFTNKDLYDRVTWSLADTLTNQRPEMPLQQSFGRFWTGAQANKLLEQGKKVPFAGGLLDIYGNVGLLEPGALTNPDTIHRALERRKDWYNLPWQK